MEREHPKKDLFKKNQKESPGLKKGSKKGEEKSSKGGGSKKGKGSLKEKGETAERRGECPNHPTFLIRVPSQECPLGGGNGARRAYQEKKKVPKAKRAEETHNHKTTIFIR